MAEYLQTCVVDGESFQIASVLSLTEKHDSIKKLPFSLRVLLENVLRTAPEGEEKTKAIQAILSAAQPAENCADAAELRFYPARVLMHDFSIPALVDLAAMREAIARLGGDPELINPLVPVGITIDHSAQVDVYGDEKSLRQNCELEYQRNEERIALLKWAGKTMRNVTVVPPAKGICHQLHLEYFTPGYMTGKNADGATTAFPDTLVGADSHTGTLCGMGVLSYGIGGIEIETVMLGEPCITAVPQVVGVRLVGTLSPYSTATDLALTLTAFLREAGVVEKFVEFTGPGVDSLSIPARCTVANMAPEYGATLGFFPIDAEVIRYLRLTGREKQAKLTEEAAKAGGLFRCGEEALSFSQLIEFDLGQVEPSLAGPTKPQQHIPLRNSQKIILQHLNKEETKRVAIHLPGHDEAVSLSHGDIALAAITSCTNTINPELMIGAGILARNAVQRGLRIPPYVKTVLAPGSTTVTRCLEKSGLLEPLTTLGFHPVGFSCMTCIGNSGPLREPVAKAITENNLNVAAVLSANRNFSGRVHPLIRSNFLASPMLVVAFALSGSITTDLEKQPLGTGADGLPVFLRDILPSQEEIRTILTNTLTPELFTTEYAALLDGGPTWDAIAISEGTTFVWDEQSTYLRRPPYFDGATPVPQPVFDILDSRVLALFGDGVTTDHISPAGSIPASYPAGRYLLDHGVREEDFNVYGTRRGNHEVMTRGTFANIRLQNLLVAPREGGFTKKFPQGEEMFIFDAAEAYRKEKTPLIILAGKEYGTGSSRDWAAKGVYFLGVRAVIARSFERIHRNNLVGMGVLPLQFMPEDSTESLGLTGEETFSLRGLDAVAPKRIMQVEALRPDGSILTFPALARLDTPYEQACFKNGGILPYVLRQFLRRQSA